MENMNRSNFALFVALLIHLVFFLLFWIVWSITPEFKVPENEENKIKISLKEFPKKSKTYSSEEKILKPSPKPKEMPKGSQLKKIVKKEPIKYDPKNIRPKKDTLPINIEPVKTEPKKAKQKPQPKIEPIPLKKPYIPLTKLQENIKTDKSKKEKEDTKTSLYDILSQDKSASEKAEPKRKNSSRSSIDQNIKELYGDEFGKLTPGQQRYILDNQEIMRRITQQVLNRVASVNLSGNLNVNQTNVVEFYLHPNGDMTDFRFLKHSGYYVLDDTTKETIEYAYSKYPRPDEKILIRYNVFYNLAHH